MTKRYQDKELLRELYHGEGMSTREIADRLDCDSTTVLRWLKEYDIDTRSNWKRGVEAAKQANRKERVKLRSLDRGYEYWTTKVSGDFDTKDGRKAYIVYVHRLAAVAEYGFDAVSNAVVHHKNNVPWDNRPENLELMSRSEHQNTHRAGATYKNGAFVK